MRNDEWMQDAACRGMDVNIFYPGDGEVEDEAVYEEARSICAGCPVQAQCRDYAIATRDWNGMWGGMTELERHRLDRKQRRVRWNAKKKMQEQADANS